MRIFAFRAARADVAIRRITLMKCAAACVSEYPHRSVANCHGRLDEPGFWPLASSGRCRTRTHNRFPSGPSSAQSTVAPTRAILIGRHNEFALVSATSSQTVRLVPGQALEDPFSVRYVDAQGHPLQGLAVSFFADGCGEPGIDPPHCPPRDIYGHFTPPMDSVVHTDANGVATSNAFVAGSNRRDLQRARRGMVFAI